MDLDVFDDLRDGVRDRTHSPDMSRIFRTARQRRRSHTAATVAGFAVVALLGAGTATAVPNLLATPASPTIAPVAGSLSATVSTQTCLEAPEVVTAKVAFAQTCNAEGNSRALAVTTDAGHTWRRWLMPSPYVTIPPPYRYCHRQLSGAQ
ncbi:hypothetical protein [Fodinicola feengrottensis]|uniref:hypothetical protein n=1 Tax=Fodinicola feengrottensis TaxID=435914 RepID=UPI0013D8E0B7|nr:hypothetical protein [Fodinicola feengrottensis]